MPKRRHLDDQTYFQIMEKVAEENNPIWNENRAREGYPTLSVDEDYLRILNDNSYNYRGFYDKYPESAANADSHWPDEFKTVWHPTFSVESTYSGKRSQYNPEGVVGGYWIGDNFYTPPNKPRRSLKSGGAIHIDPANRGKFNATKERTGKTTEELTHSKNPLTRKRAIFAQNAAKWNH